MRLHDPILLVEDDQVDQKAIQRAFHDLKIVNPITIARNGKEALAHLRESETKRPCLILLDLRMSVMSGIEFLEAVKKDEHLKLIPVVVLTTSKEDQDLTRSFALGAAGYMVKPVDYTQFLNVVKTIHLYWVLSLTPPM